MTNFHAILLFRDSRVASLAAVQVGPRELCGESWAESLGPSVVVTTVGIGSPQSSFRL